MGCTSMIMGMGRIMRVIATCDSHAHGVKASIRCRVYISLDPTNFQVVNGSGPRFGICDNSTTLKIDTTNFTSLLRN